MYVVYENNQFLIRGEGCNIEKKLTLYANYLNRKVNELKVKNNLSKKDVEKIKIIIGNQLLNVGQIIEIDIISTKKIKTIFKVSKHLYNSVFSTGFYVLRNKRFIVRELAKRSV